ncbi:MAG: glycerophosphodiester phosphodiesterase [Actinomycetota bacterium]
MSYRRRAHPQVVAHRGNSSEHPDNSEAGVRSAIELGADMVEVDVQVTADGVGVLYHDLEIVHHGDTMTVADLPVHTVDGLLSPFWLDELLDLAGGDVPLNLDVKADAAVELLVREIDARGLHDHVVISGCTPGLLRRHRADAGRISFLLNLRRWEQAFFHFGDRVPGPIDRALRSLFRAWIGVQLRRFRVIAVNVPKRGVDAALVESVRRRGVEVWTYTADEGDEIERLAATGVGSITTNRPSFALGCLGRGPDHAERSST